MAITITVASRADLMNGVHVISGTVTMDSSYPTGGETMDLSSYFTSTSSPTVVFSPSPSGYVLAHDGGTAATGVVKALYGNNDAASDGPLIEVPNATDLSAVAAKFIAIGSRF